jgi:hypothetical protein
MKTITKTKTISGIAAAALTLTLLSTIAAGTQAFAKEHHCTTGYDDCYNLGFQTGQSNAQNNVSIDWSVYNSHSAAWQHGYDDGINSVKNTNIVSDSPSNSQSSTVNIRGDNNRVNVEQGQSIASGNGDGSDSGGGNSDGQGGFLPECRVLCLGIK